MKKNKTVLIFQIICYIGLIFCKSSFAQYKSDDCAVYEKVLMYLNAEYEKPRYVYEGVIDPESENAGKKVERVGHYNYSFYIVNKRNVSFMPSSIWWFVELTKDSSIVQKDYVYNEDTLINCVFKQNIKYQYKNFDEVYRKGFSEKDFLFEQIDGIDFHYTPMRIRLSRILYTKDNKALVVATTRVGVGGGGDQWAYCFILKKENDNWIIYKTGGEVI